MPTMKSPAVDLVSPWMIPLRSPFGASIELHLPGVFDLLVEEIAEERPDPGNRPEVTDFIPGWRKRRADEIGGKLKRQRGNQPLREIEPDRSAALASRGRG